MGVKRNGVRHKQVGEYHYAVFALPEGDHYRWTVTRSDMSERTTDHFGRQLTTGTAKDEAEAWLVGKSWLNKYLLRTYLEGEFPGQTVSEFSHPERGGQGFRIHDGVPLVALVSDEFLEDTDTEKIMEILRRWNLAQAMRTMGKDTVVFVTTEGLRSEERRRL